MKLSGEIKLKGPGLKRQELSVDTEDGNGMEVLTTRTAKKMEDVDFSLMVNMQDDDEISIMTEVVDFETLEDNKDFYFYMYTPEKRGISIQLNYAQARALNGLLEDHINAHNLLEKLLKPITVNSA